MNKRLSLDEIEVTSFVINGKTQSGGLAKYDDGTLEFCHCPTALCGPSANIGWTMCCL